MLLPDFSLFSLSYAATRSTIRAGFSSSNMMGSVPSRTSHGTCRFISRTGYQLSGFQHLERWLAEHLKVKDAILDGELCCLDESGRPQFNQLELRSQEAHYIAFDLL